MRVGITGGSGFIGHYVTAALLARGDEVMWLDHQGTVPLARHGTHTFLGDVRDATAVTEFAAHVDGIIHLAAVLGTQETIGNPRPAAETNVGGSLNIFEAVAQYDLPAVYIAVGNHMMRTQGAGAYVISKTCAEDFVKMFNQHRGTRIATVRAMNAYGPGQSASKPYGWSPVRKILPAFICRALSGQPIEIYGDGKQVSDMVYVGDVARALVGALDAAAENRPMPTIEVGPADHKTVNDVALAVAKACAPYSESGIVDIVHVPMRPGETPGARVVADTSTLAHVGMSDDDLLPLPIGIARTVEWFVANEGVTWRKVA